MESVLKPYNDIYLLPSNTPIQALVIPGNILCTQVCDYIYSRSQIRLYPIKAPTVSIERVRIVLHAHNTPEEVERLVHLIGEALEQLARMNKDQSYSMLLVLLLACEAF